MTMGVSDTKTAEFSRLFNLFERLASRGPGASDSDAFTTMGDVRPNPIPDDLAPVFRNLATLVTTRTNRDHTRQKQGDGRRRRNTVAPTSADIDSDSDAESVAKFPIKKQYPFTFKLMLHKLYELEEWAKKIKEVVEESQMQFKPLGELEVEKAEEVARRKSDGHVYFDTRLTVGGGRRGSLPPTRLRRHSFMGVGKGKNTGNASIARTQQPKLEMDPRVNARALKKRCIGRRKSMGGPMTGAAGSAGNAWIYDAAISAVEVATQVKGPNHSRMRYQSLGGGQQVGGRDRRISRPARGSFNGQQETPQQYLHPDGDCTAKRKSMSVADVNSWDEAQRMKMKRPLSA